MGNFWIDFGTFEQLWVSPEGFGSFWASLGPTFELLKAFGQLLDSLGVFGGFWTTFGASFDIWQLANDGSNA